MYWIRNYCVQYAVTSMYFLEIYKHQITFYTFLEYSTIERQEIQTTSP